MSIEENVGRVIAALCRKYSEPAVPPEIKLGGQGPTEASVIGAKAELVKLSSTFNIPSSMVYPGLSKHLTDLEHCSIKFIDRIDFVKMLIDGQPALIRNIYKMRFLPIQRKEFADLDPSKLLESDFNRS